MFKGMPRADRPVRWLFAMSLVVMAMSMGPSPARADDASQARFHFERALKLYEQERYEEALREFFIVNRLSPDAATLFNIASCFDELGRADQAFLYFNRYLESGEAAGPQGRIARRKVEQLESEVARVRIVTSPPGARVFIDYREHGSWGRTPLTVPLSSGEHTVWLSLENHRDVELQVETELGQKTRIQRTLVPIVGTVVVESVPPGEALLTDGDGATVAGGTTPLSAQVPPGLYVLEVVAPEHRPQQSVVRVEPDTTSRSVVELEALPPAGGELAVTANPPGALVEVDGEPVGFAPAVLTDVQLGLRQVRVSADDTQPWEGSVDVRDSGRGWLNAVLAPPPKTERSVATWVFGGIGVSAAAAAIVTGVLALDAQNEFERSKNDPGGGTSARQLKEQGETLAGVTDALWIAAGVSVATSVVLFFATAKKTQPSEASLTWDVQ